MKFLNCKIKDIRGVFRPRKETEFWVGKIIKEFKNVHADCLDIFSGSGCMGIAVLKNLKNTRVDFSDISRRAVRQIKNNLKINKISPDRYKIFQSDLFKNLAKKKYDFIFANPPYVALDRIREVQKEVLQSDPQEALFSGKDGMDAIRKFLLQAPKYLKPKGKILMELDPYQVREIKIILLKLGLNGRFHKDQFNKYRWLAILNK